MTRFKGYVLILILADLVFLAGAIVFYALNLLFQPFYAFIFLFPCIPLTIRLYQALKIYNITTKLNKATQEKNYQLADEIITKYIEQYPFLAVTRTNNYLAKGEIGLYLYHYQNFKAELNHKRLRYYRFLLEIYKIYYDLLCGNSLNLTKAQSVQGIDARYAPKICCEAMELVVQNKFDIALNLIRQSVLSGGEFSQFIYAYVQYLCAKGLEKNEKEYLEKLKKLAYNDYLKNIVIGLS